MVVGRTVTVTTTATDLLAGLGVKGEARIWVKFSNAQFWLGDASVTVNDGYTVSGPGSIIELTLQAGDTIHAIVAGGTPTVDLLVYSV